MGLNVILKGESGQCHIKKGNLGPEANAHRGNEVKTHTKTFIWSQKQKSN